MKKKFKLKSPHVYVLLTAIVIIAFIATFIIPSGEFDRVEDENTGNMVVVNGSFHTVEKDNLTLFDLPLSIVGGMQNSSSIILLVLIFGGAFQIISSTDILNIAACKVAKRMKNNATLIIPVFLVFFSVLGFSFGLSQEILIFIPIGVYLARTLGFDSITGVAMMQLGVMCGFTAGLFNPYNVGVAQGIAGLPLYSGLWYRVIVLLVMLILTAIHVIRYAKRIKKNPTLSLSRETEGQLDRAIASSFENVKFSKRQMAAMITLIAGFIIFMYGVMKLGWYLMEMSAAMLSLGVACGFVGGKKASEIAVEFIEGAKALTFGALITGLAAGVAYVMSQGMILDTVVNAIFKLISVFPSGLQAVGIFISQMIINFFIISGTGQAAVVMPILMPLSDLTEISKQTMVLAFQLGDGFTNSLYPTAGTLMAVLSMAKIKYESWVKFVLPLMIQLVIASAILVFVADMIGYQ